MSDKKFTAYATATVTVEVHGLGSWGAECQLSQIIKQASEEAVGRLRRMDKDQRLRVVGEPTIKTVIVEDK